MDPLKTQAPQEAKLHFLDYWRIIRIRKTVILAVFLLVVITATIVTSILPKYYASTAQIRIERDLSDIQPVLQPQMFPGYDPYFIQTEFEFIKSETILSKVIEKLNLNTEWGRKYAGGEKLKTSESMGLLKRNLVLNAVRNTTFIEIMVYSEDPKEAARIANAVAEVYRDERLEERRQLTSGGIKSLETQFDDLDKKISKAQDEKNALLKELNISDSEAMGTTPSPMLEAQSLRQFEGQRIEGEARLATKETTFNQLTNVAPGELKNVLPRTVPDALLNELLARLSLAEVKLVALKVDMTDQHPDVIKAQAEVDDLNKKVQEAVDGIMTSLSNEVVASKSGVAKLKTLVDEAKKQDQDKAQKSQPYFEKKDELERLQNLRHILEAKITSEKWDMELPKTLMVRITGRAEPGSRPVRPRILFNIVAGIVIGLIVGVGLAFFIEYLDTSVKTIDDVERSLQAPVLGVIPQNASFLLEEGAESPHAEAYRVLRTNLLFSRKDEKLTTVAVVSAGAGEGKSTTVLNLATVFAQCGQRVIVVNSDLRRPTLHKMLRLTNSIGLTNYLLKQNTLEEVIQPTILPSLDFMASGRLPSSSLGILSSVQMKDLINELKQRYDFVFFDSPPIMGVSDASILASEVDIALQVIQYRRYPQPMNIRAKQLIEKVGGKLVGIVLNNINVSQDEIYYYYSGYYHDYYSKNEEMAGAAPADKTSGDKKKVEAKQKN